MTRRMQFVLERSSVHARHTQRERFCADLVQLQQEELFQDITIGAGDGNTRCVIRRISRS